MASAVEVAAYRAAGHTVAETCERFGIKERAVYKACQVTRHPHRASTPQLRRVEPGSHERRATPPEPPPAPVFRDVASDDEIAGDNTYWKCPATGELMPAVPGSSRKTWNAERIALHKRRVQLFAERAPAPEAAGEGSAPVPAPAPQGTPAASASAPVPAPAESRPVPVPGAPAPTTPRMPEPLIVVKRLPLPSTQASVGAALRVYLVGHLPPPNIVFALAVVLVLILACSW
ncbi:MAG TPA: hypothetical protein VLA19_01605 [Herpetosiphonaceae bacterium]|nr:hypothetical protein [Herpetosiphonaceae bacterium]